MASLFWWADDAAQLIGMLAGAVVPIGIEGGEQVGFIEACAGAEQSGDRDSVFADAAVESFDDHASEAGMHGVARHLCGGSAGRSKTIEQFTGGVDGRWRRRIEPFECGQPHGLEIESELGQLAPCDLGCIVLRTALEVLRSVQAQNAAGSGAARTACTLHSGCLADAADVEGGQAGPGGIGCDAG